MIFQALLCRIILQVAWNVRTALILFSSSRISSAVLMNTRASFETLRRPEKPEHWDKRSCDRGGKQEHTWSLLLAGMNEIRCIANAKEQICSRPRACKNFSLDWSFEINRPGKQDPPPVLCSAQTNTSIYGKVCLVLKIRLCPKCESPLYVYIPLWVI